MNQSPFARLLCLALASVLTLILALHPDICAQAQTVSNVKMTAEPGAKALKIVGYGASSMRGWRDGVTKEQTFRALLADGLKARGVPAEVTDAAQPGNTSTDAMTRFERDVLHAK